MAGEAKRSPKGKSESANKAEEKPKRCPTRARESLRMQCGRKSAPRGPKRSPEEPEEARRAAHELPKETPREPNCDSTTRRVPTRSAQRDRKRACKGDAGENPRQSGPRGAQERARRPHEAPTTSQRIAHGGPKRAQKEPRRAQLGSRKTPRAPEDGATRAQGSLQTQSWRKPMPQEPKRIPRKR